MEQVDKDLWNGFSDALGKKGTITDIQPARGGARTFVFQDDSGTWSLSIRPRTCYILGIDIVGYSRRSLDGQLLLTTWLFSIIQSSITNLRNMGWILGNQPSVLIPTGDGALIVIDDTAHLGTAAALIYHVQMWVEDINRNHMARGVSRSFNAAQQYPVTPIHCRYVLAKGETVPIAGLNGADNAVGPGLVTCARILAASKGAHFLVHSDVMDDFDAQGGVDGVQRQGDPWNWSQSLHCALMPEKSVKSARLSFHNLFGKFKPVALLMNRGASKEDALGAPWYNLGSHDVSTIIDFRHS